MLLSPAMRPEIGVGTVRRGGVKLVMLETFPFTLITPRFHPHHPVTYISLCFFINANSSLSTPSSSRSHDLTCIPARLLSLHHTSLSCPAPAFLPSAHRLPACLRVSGGAVGESSWQLFDSCSFRLPSPRRNYQPF